MTVTAIAEPDLHAMRRPAVAPVIPDALDRHLPLLASALRISAAPTTSSVGLMASYHSGWTDPDGHSVIASTGKSLRGCLALWTGEQCGGSATAVLPVATAVEWIHNFTLVHDDVQDGDRERRHRPTVWAVYGTSQAINAGDGMHAIAYQQLLEGRDRPARRLRAGAALNRAVLAVIEGQCLDLDLERRLDTTPDVYEQMARGKTGALIGGAMEAAALLGGATPRQAELLRCAGVSLGLAFQMRDDWLGTWGDVELTGKGTGDISRRKMAYPIVVALAGPSGAARRELRRLYAQPDGDESRILALLHDCGAPAALAAALRRHGAEAMASARAAHLTPAGIDEFESVVTFVAERTS